MRVFFSPRYEVELPGHVWPTSKYRLIAERIDSRERECGSALSAFAEASADRRSLGGGWSRLTFCNPPLAPWDDLALVHTPEYLAKLRDNTLTADDIATLELPWQPAFVDAFRLMVGGTCAAAAAALEDGRAAHLGGGLHHAFAAHGEGFCPLNDVAVAIRVLQRRPSTHSVRSGQAGIRRAAVVDLDVHHGNGTAMIFERDPGVFTFSMHQQHNYPFFKPRSDLDIGLEDGAGDERYLAALKGALPRVIESRPDLIVYLAGADPFQHDCLGGLKLTKGGLAARDRLVIETARVAGIPLVTVLAGGYAADLADTVDIHVATVRAMIAPAAAV
jgi:acetoin utilization deacetylase AcuC-like enzyme